MGLLHVASRSCEKSLADPAVSVVIPSSGGSGWLARCLQALAGQTRPVDEVIVVGVNGNGRHDLTAWGAPVRGISCEGTFSFCRAVNRGLAAARGRWVLLLNDDVVLASSFLERLLTGLPADEARIGMACGKLLTVDGRRIDSAGPLLGRARTALERGHRRLDRGQFDQPGAVFSAPGACALYRREMLESLAVGPQVFDERLGMYLEDLELGWRAQRAGWRAYYVPEAVAYHARGATAKTRTPRGSWLSRYYLPWLSPKLQARYVLNRYRLIATHDSLWPWLRDSPWILWYELRLWAYLLCVERRTVRLITRVLRRVIRRSQGSGRSACGR